MGKLHSIFEDSIFRYFVLENFEGVTLFENVTTRGGYRTETRTARALRDVLECCKYLHDNGVCHGNLKLGSFKYKKPPEDTCDSENMLKLTDVCHATHVQPCGTLAEKKEKFLYNAPEVRDGKYNEKVDIWTVGCFFFLIFSGIAPVMGSSGFDKHAQYKASIWNGLREDAKDFAACCLKADPQLRPSAELCLRHVWFDSARESTLSTMAATPRTTNNVNASPHNASPLTETSQGACPPQVRLPAEHDALAARDQKDSQDARPQLARQYVDMQDRGALNVCNAHAAKALKRPSMPVARQGSKAMI